jgi:hypothetical protein
MKSTLSRAITTIAFSVFVTSFNALAVVVQPPQSEVCISATDDMAREPYDYTVNGQNVRNINNATFTFSRDNAESDLLVHFHFSGAATVCEGCVPIPNSCISVDYRIAENGTPDVIVIGASGSLRFHSGETTKTITVVPTEDFRCEPVEDVICNLDGPQPGDPVPYKICSSSPSDIVYIKDSPVSFSVTASEPTASEGLSCLKFTISTGCIPPPTSPPLPPDPDDGPGASPHICGYIISGTASPNDYILPPNSFVSPDGVHGYVDFNGNQSVDVFICPVEDCTIESSETVVMSIGSCPSSDQSATGTINELHRTLPTVAIVSPANGDTLVYPQACFIQIKVNASDNCGIAQTDYYVDGNLIPSSICPGGGVCSGPDYIIWKYPPVGKHTLIAKATSNSGLVGISAPVSITVSAFLIKPLAMQFVGDTFSFDMMGTNGDYSVLSSEDGVTWSSAGTITINDVPVTFNDTQVGGVLNRFYRVQGNGLHSVSTVGFINKTVLAKKPNNTRQYVALANQLNNPAGNTLDVLFDPLPRQSQALIWDQGVGSWHTYTKGGTPAYWFETTTLNPSQGAVLVSAGGTDPIPVTFVGEVPQGQQVETFSTTTGGYNLLSSIIPRAGTLNELGFPAMEGDQFLKYNNDTQQWDVQATFTSGAWSPVIPEVQMGESFFLHSGSTGTRTWTQNLPTYAPTVAVTSPAEGSTFVGPASIALSATASADAGINKVEFFQGATSLGLGAQNGSSYSFNWNNPGTGTYSITAHATDNNGITTISLPVNITVYAQPGLSSEVMSGGNFQFAINGSLGVSVEVKASEDLATWTSLGTVTLTGGSYSFTDTGASAFAHRFYRVQENGVCSANTVGFINKTVLAKKPDNTRQYVSLANQLNNPAGNSLDVLFDPLPKQSQALIWNQDGGGWYTYTKGGTPAYWFETTTLNPSQGAVVVSAGGTTPIPVTFVGDVPQGQQVKTFSTTAGGYILLSSIIPRAGTLNELGFPAMEGDQFLKYNNDTQQWEVQATFTSGAWNQVPTMQIGESFFLLSGTTGTRTWTQNLPTCP